MMEKNPKLKPTDWTRSIIENPRRVIVLLSFSCKKYPFVVATSVA
jgi:hypothetical protein